MKKFCISLCVLLLGVFSGHVYAITVPNDECPNSPNSQLIAPCHSLKICCERSDSNVIDVSGGTSEKVSSGKLNCPNCEGCPEDPPPRMACTQMLSISFTEEVTTSIASGIQASGGVILAELRATLEASIGHSNQRTETFSSICGSNEVSSCRKISYALLLSTTQNVQKKIEHTYEWKVILSHNPKKCKLLPDHKGPYPLVTYEPAGMAVSTVTGSTYGEAGCKPMNYSTCP